MKRVELVAAREAIRSYLKAFNIDRDPQINLDYIDTIVGVLKLAKSNNADVESIIVESIKTYARESAL